MVSTTTEFSCRDCKHQHPHSYSHPGYFGKKGQRFFHYKRNQFYTPTVNLDNLWSLVSEETRTKAPKDKAPVIDATKAVTIFYIIYHLLVGLLQGPGEGRSAQATSHCQSQVVLQASRKEDKGGRRRLRVDCLRNNS